MSNVIITITDAAGDNIKLSVEYAEGFRADSPACQAAIMITKFMDQIADVRAPPAVHGAASGELGAAMTGDLPQQANDDLQRALAKMRQDAEVRVAAKNGPYDFHDSSRARMVDNE